MDTKGQEGLDWQGDRQLTAVEIACPTLLPTSLDVAPNQVFIFTEGMNEMKVLLTLRLVEEVASRSESMDWSFIAGESEVFLW